MVAWGLSWTGVAVACLNKNMESHVLQRQSNNKRGGEQSRRRAARQLTVPQCSQRVSQDILRLHTDRFENEVFVGKNVLFFKRKIRLHIQPPCWGRAANRSHAKLSLCSSKTNTYSKRRFKLQIDQQACHSGTWNFRTSCFAHVMCYTHTHTHTEEKPLANNISWTTDTFSEFACSQHLHASIGRVLSDYPRVNPRWTAKKKKSHIGKKSCIGYLNANQATFPPTNF